MKIRVPATSANLGPGFDALGLAIALYNEVVIKKSTFHSVSIKGEGSNRSNLKKNNLFISIFNDIYKELTGEKDTFRFEFNNNIPFSRGLGSSSAVIISAIASAYEMADIVSSKQNVLNRALVYEAHPDNIAPAVYGGFVSSVVEENKVYAIKKELPSSLKVVMTIPDRAMSTSHSRTKLPKNFSIKNTVFNLAHASFLSSAFFSENWDMLQIASKDMMHEKIRISAMPELECVRKTALENGALMSTLSGSGSSFFTLCYNKDASKIKEALKKNFGRFRIEVFNLDNNGYTIDK